MPRARNIKHSFFVSEQVGDNEPLGRLLFIGLWTVADFKGDLVWKPKTIKVQILPFDNCDIKQLAINLDKSGLIRFYSDGDQIYINIPEFVRHQNPHINEKRKGSEIPAYSEAMRQVVDFNTLAINPDKNGKNPDQYQTNPADSLILIPDSRSLNPDSGNQIPDSIPPATQGCADTSLSTRPKPRSPAKGAETWKAYSDAYFGRYGVDPVRNAKTSAQIAQLVDRLGADDAPHVAAFYVNHSSSFYVSRMHSVNGLLADAEKLRTEWATGRRVTQTIARQADKTASNPFAAMLTNQEFGK